MRWEALDAMIDYAEGSECRHADILTYFKDENRITRCGHCDSCDPKSKRRIKPILSILSKPKNKKKKPLPGQDIKLTFEQEEQLSQLRTWRKDYAKSQDIPAFMVFSDKTLRDLVIRKPESTSDLFEIYGLGEKKIETFGQELVDQLI